MIYLLDTSAVLIHYRQEPGCERVLCLFDDPASVVLLSSLSLAEFGRVLRSTGLNPADSVPCGYRGSESKGAGSIKS